MIIDIGNNKVNDAVKSYPIKRKVGVPNNSKPTPNNDWKMHKTVIIKISIIIKKNL